MEYGYIEVPEDYWITSYSNYFEFDVEYLPKEEDN